jgi:hypothetical protein
MLPTVAQFLKIAALKHSVLVQVLGSIFFFHWLTLELLIQVAKPERIIDSLTAQQIEDIVTRVGELLFIDDHNTDQGVYNTMFEERLDCIYHTLISIYGFSAIIILWAFFWPKSLSFSSRAGYMIIACIGLTSLFILPIISVLPLKSDLKATRRILRKPAGVKTKAALLRESQRFGGPNVGGFTGTLMLIFWILWCILCFDGKGSDRPDWPWLDWLG